MVQSTEEWAYVVGHEGNYAVSTAGNVWSRQSDGTIGQSTKPSGHKKVTIRGRQRYVHRLVMEAFIGPCPEGMEVCHGNGDPRDNRLENLRYDTARGNQGDRKDHGTHPRGIEMKVATRFTEDDVREVRRLHAEGMSCKQIARKFNAPHASTVRAIIKGKTWKWVDNPEMVGWSRRLSG